MCKRGDIYSVDFGNNHDSHKQSGIRPAIVVSIIRQMQIRP